LLRLKTLLLTQKIKKLIAIEVPVAALYIRYAPRRLLTRHINVKSVVSRIIVTAAV